MARSTIFRQIFGNDFLVFPFIQYIDYAEQRAAFAEFHITGKVPRQVDADGTAARNIAAITAELLQNLEQLAAAA